MSRFAAALLLALLAACTIGEVVGEAPPPTVAESPSQDPHGALTCDAETQAGIDETIDGQLAALGEGDYGSALGFASERFRSGTTPEQFQQVIEADYPLLIGATGHRSELCVAQGEIAQLLVTVEAANGQSDELVYSMTRENSEWRIDIAGRAAGSEAEAVPVGPASQEGVMMTMSTM